MAFTICIQYSDHNVAVNFWLSCLFWPIMIRGNNWEGNYFLGKAYTCSRNLWPFVAQKCLHFWNLLVSISPDLSMQSTSWVWKIAWLASWKYLQSWIRWVSRKEITRLRSGSRLLRSCSQESGPALYSVLNVYGVFVVCVRMIFVVQPFRDKSGTCFEMP